MMKGLGGIRVSFAGICLGWSKQGCESLRFRPIRVTADAVCTQLSIAAWFYSGCLAMRVGSGYGFLRVRGRWGNESIGPSWAACCEMPAGLIRDSMVKSVAQGLERIE